MKREQNVLKQIFRDHWGEFWPKNRGKFPVELAPAIEESVRKMLACGEQSQGYAEYICTSCQARLRVPFTCKSRFCPKCGKVYTDRWVERECEAILDVSHRHYVFTIPKEFRSIVYWDRQLIKVMSDAAATVVQETLSGRGHKGQVPAIVTVVHTFGRDLKFNPHVHCLVAEGVWDPVKEEWVPIGFVPYEVLRKKWQYHLCKGFRQEAKAKAKVSRLVDKLYREKTNGFYVNAESRMKSARGAARYIGRYLGRPAIALSRIESYDGFWVVFRYEDHATGEEKRRRMTAEQFIGALLMHIPVKHFKMVRQYGLYSRRGKGLLARVKDKLQGLVQKVFEFAKGRGARKSWRQRLVEAFQRDPLLCRRCGQEMDLWLIWHPRYGEIYYMGRDAPVALEPG